MKQVSPVVTPTPTPQPTPQPTPRSSPQRPERPPPRSAQASPVRGVSGVTPLPESIDFHQRYLEQLASARQRRTSGSSQGSSAYSTTSSMATDPGFKTPPPVGLGGIRELLRRQSNQPGFQSPRLASATISSAEQLEQLEAQTKVMGIQETLDWAARSVLDDPAPTGEHPGLESATNIMPTLSQTAPASVVLL